MNTIIYLYHSRESAEFLTEKWQESDYCLIRLGIPEFLWQNLRILEQEIDSRKDEPMPLVKQRVSVGKARNWYRRFRKRKNEQADEIKETNDATAKQLQKLLNDLQELQTALSLLGDNPHWTYCVYEDFLKEKINTRIWWQYWRIPEFEDYHERMWVEKLIQYAVPGHYMILGYADCMPEILCQNARKMRSVKWFLEERHYTREMQTFIEDFYEEYGLAVEVRLLKEEWFRVRPSGEVPVNVLDFTGEEKISACDVARGSIWLDMDSLDGKNRRMESRNPGINYFSLKKQWKQRQKETINLDTISKNRYNT